MAPDQEPTVDVGDRWNDDEVTVTVQGDIDFVSVGTFTDHMAEVIHRNPRQLVIDMAGVEFMDSAGLHAFVRIRGMVPEGCHVLLRSARPRIRQVFAITGLDTAFDFGLPTDQSTT